MQFFNYAWHSFYGMLNFFFSERLRAPLNAQITEVTVSAIVTTISSEVMSFSLYFSSINFHQLIFINPFSSIHFHQFIFINSFLSAHFYQFISINSFSSIHFHQFIFINSFSSIHFHQFIFIIMIILIFRFTKIIFTLI